MSVKRYQPAPFNERVLHSSEDGEYVKYEDYSALEARCAALVAENAGLKEACGGDGSYRDCPACAHSEYIEAPETPATDAFLADVMAQGVEMFADNLLCPDLDGTIREFADELRKGVQS
ncbi:hypothetical protein ACQRMG_004665 [Enterobacter hormaechei]